MKKIIYLISIAAFIFTLYNNISIEYNNSIDLIATSYTIGNMANADITPCSDCSELTCAAGGPGSSACSVSVGGGGIGAECSVTCNSPCYACCDNFKTKCLCCS